MKKIKAYVRTKLNRHEKLSKLTVKNKKNHILVNMKYTNSDYREMKTTNHSMKLKIKKDTIKGYYKARKKNRLGGVKYLSKHVRESLKERR